MKERLLEIVKMFPTTGRVAVIGDLCLDTYLYGESTRVNPEKHGASLVKIVRNERRLGMAANVAANAAALGADVELYGLVGDDEGGRQLMNLIETQSGFTFVPYFEGETIEKQRTLVAPHNHYVGRNDYGEASLAPISTDAQDELFKYLKRREPTTIILSDYNKRVFTGDFGKRIIDYALQQGITTVVDPKPENIASFAGATIISPNLEATERITGLRAPHYEALAQRLQQLTKSRCVVVTLGKEGMITYSDHKDLFHIPTRARELGDVSGAGDTVKAALALSSQQGTFYDSAQIANYAAGIVVEKQGTATASIGELIERIRED